MNAKRNAGASVRLQSGMVVLLAAVTLFAAAPLRASLIQVNIGLVEGYSQVSSAAPTTPSSFSIFFSYVQNAGDFTSASLTYPGPGSPQTLPTSGTKPVFTSSPFSTLSGLQSAYPFGTYTFNLSNGSTMATESDNYSQNLFPGEIPAFAASTFTGLQGLNTTNAFTANFNTFTPNSGISNPNAFTELYIIAGGVMVFDSGVLPDSITSLVIPADTLLPNTTYTAHLIFNNDFATKDSVTGVVSAQGFNENTAVQFTTAVPEPSTLILFGLSALCLAGVRFWSPTQSMPRLSTRGNPGRGETRDGGKPGNPGQTDISQIKAVTR
jgi:hypothetical protein